MTKEQAEAWGVVDKRCSHCTETLPLTDFGWSRDKRAGGRHVTRIQSWCKDCVNQWRTRKIFLTEQAVIRRLWTDKRLRLIYLGKLRGTVPEGFRLQPNRKGGTIL
jgi:hypothetical protein